MRWPGGVAPRDRDELLTVRRQLTEEDLRRQLPANQAAAERNNALLAQKTPEASRARAEAAEEARKARAARVARWTGMRDRIAEAIRHAEGQRHGALEAEDVEAAVQAQQRLMALKALIEPLRQAAVRDLGPAFNPALMERV